MSECCERACDSESQKLYSKDVDKERLAPFCFPKRRGCEYRVEANLALEIIPYDSEREWE